MSTKKVAVSGGIELATGKPLEYDIIRHEDNYGRN